ncbi:MAG: hypothetical protein WCT49_01155 [Candidatus Paceibacterota bacterium]|jgi:hypothetical protein|nr:hypothetical protein [Candidatus Paceibacterota bacterium]
MKNQEHSLEEVMGEKVAERAPKEGSVEMPAQKPEMDTTEQQERIKQKIEAMNFPSETPKTETMREPTRLIPKMRTETTEKHGLWNSIARYFEERKRKHEIGEAERFDENAFSTLEYLLEERKSETVLGVKIEDVLQALAGEDSPKAEQMRERYKTDMGYWEAITLSYTGVDTPSAREWREKVMKMGEEDKTYKKLAQAALASLAGIENDRAKEMRERGTKLCGDAEQEYIGESYRGINNEEANAWREKLMEKYKEFLPQKQKLDFEMKACDESDKKGWQTISREIDKLHEKNPHVNEAPDMIAESLSGVQSEKTDEMLSWCFEEIFKKGNQHEKTNYLAFSALTGRSDDLALKLLERSLEVFPSNFIMESLAGRDDKKAWEMREEFFHRYMEDRRNMPGGGKYDSNDMPHNLASLARSLAGIKTKKSEKWRRSLLEKKHNAGGLGIHKVGVDRSGIAQSFFGNPRTVAYKFLKKNTVPALHLPEIESTMPIMEQISAAESILGHENVRGPWSMGIKADMEKLPPIPFTAEKLAEAKERGAYLKYQMPDDEQGKPMTTEYLIERFGEKLKAEGYGDIVQNADRHKERGESVFTEDSPRKGWFLVETRPVPFSSGKSAVEQTELMIAYLKDHIFEREKLPEVYESAAEEFEKHKGEILKLLNKEETRVEGCRMLEELRITRLLRPWPVELVMDQIADWMANKKYLYEGMDILTGRQSPNTGRFTTITGSNDLKMGSMLGIGLGNHTDSAQTIISRPR